MSPPLIASLLVLSLAGPGEIELRWEAPAGCPDREQMLARLVTPPGDDDLEPIEVSAVVQKRISRMNYRFRNRPRYVLYARAVVA